MTTLTLDLDGVEHLLSDKREHFIRTHGGRLVIALDPDPQHDVGYFASSFGIWSFVAHLDRAPNALRLDDMPVTVASTEVSGRVSLRLRAAANAPTVPVTLKRTLFANRRPQRSAPAQRPGSGRTAAGRQREWVIGRPGTGADIEVDDPQVQADHARISVDENGSWWVTPANGPVYADGKRWFNAVLDPGQTFVVGQTSVVVDPQLLLAGGIAPNLAAPPPVRVSAGKGLAVRLSHVTVRRSGRVLLDDVNLEIPGGEVVAVLGPSGAGKSSLIKVLLGEYSAERGGSVILGAGNDSQYSDSQSRREQVRYVPQSDDLYEQLSVTETLRFAARFRSARDSTAAEIDKRVADVLSWLRLEAKLESGNAAEHRVAKLSGGERRRVSIGMELVGRPQLLLLDEPTSGLDLGKDRAIMEQLHRLSRELHCTIIVVTHSVAHLEHVDRVVMLAPGGRLQYQGPPAEALSANGYVTWADWLDELDKFQQRKEFHVPGRTYGKPSSMGEARLTGLRTALARQSVLLARRGWKSLAQLLAMPLIGTLIAVIASSDGLRSGQGMAQVLAILVTVSALTGASLTYQDLVTERQILQRDWRVGISAAPLILAKILVFGAVCAVLSVLMSLFFSALRELPKPALGVNPLLMLVISLFLVMLGSMGVGLLISAVAKTTEQAVTYNTFLAVLQVALNGSLFHLEWGVQFLTLVLPARLGLAAIAGYAELNRLRPPGVFTDSLWGHGSIWFWSMTLGLIGVFITTGVIATRKAESRWRG